MARTLAIAVICTLGFSACGGGGDQPPPLPVFTGDNVLDVVVDPGPPGLTLAYTNGLFATISVCEPGTSNCTTIDHLLVDTGSVGVRVLESLVKVPLPTVTNSSGEALAACAPFVDGSAWGPLRKADVQIGQEAASGLTVQLIGASTAPLPSTCTGTTITDLEQLGANGILGVGIYVQDCGTACSLSARSSSNPGVYYACGTTGCSVTAVPMADQVGNPVAAFPVDNNGVIIALPRIASTGALSVPGQLVFGIGTQANNDLGSAALVALDLYGFANTTFPAGGTAYASIIDSGSNGLFFLDTATTKLKQCTGGLSDFYCPSSTANFNAGLVGPSGSTSRFNFSVANPAELNGAACAFSNLAGPMPGYPSSPTLPAFDWGLPFFFGRVVFTAIESRPTPAGSGPYLAF